MLSREVEFLSLKFWKKYFLLKGVPFRSSYYIRHKYTNIQKSFNFWERVLRKLSLKKQLEWHLLPSIWILKGISSTLAGELEFVHLKPRSPGFLTDRGGKERGACLTCSLQMAIASEMQWDLLVLMTAGKAKGENKPVVSRALGHLELGLCWYGKARPKSTHKQSVLLVSFPQGVRSQEKDRRRPRHGGPGRWKVHFLWFG